MQTDAFNHDTSLPDTTTCDPANADLKPAFCIDSLESANWLVRRVIEARAYGEKVRTWAAAEQRRAEREETQLMHLFGRQLQAWVVRDISLRRGRCKSIRLPAGTVGFRRLDLKLRVHDRGAVLNWAKTMLPQAVVTRELLSKAAINDHFAQTGEIPGDGVTIEPEHEVFFIR